MEKLNPHFVVDAYEKEKAISKYLDSITEVGLWNSEKKVITNYIPKDGKILELGCGTGRVTYNLYNLGYHNIMGIDLSTNMILAAKNFAETNGAKIKYEVDDAINLKKTGTDYDGVLFLFNGLMLIPGRENRIKVLKEVRRILKEDGKFIFTSHDLNGNKEYQQFWDKEKENWNKGNNNKKLWEYGDLIDSEIDENDSFIHFPTDDEIYIMAKEEGFKVEYSEFRDNIAEENEKTKKFSGNTKFWVFKK